LPKINRMRFTHDPPPITVNHISKKKGIHHDSYFVQHALDQGVRVAIYRRVAPLRREAVTALGAELARAYPSMRSVFEHPEAQPMR
ncbi:hypothetical protein U1839_26150, partial [Sphingomonas sp. RT2P30]|uniref:hypothetical protein n=1 Tax=Parasphingomonas halimpatiens TaxID=3096162 RepID=UPI002FC84DFD